MTNYNAHQRNLRKGRFSKTGYCYFITTGTKDRHPVFSDPLASMIVMDCLKWLDEKGRIDLIAVVVMPDHIHFVVRLCGTSLSSLMHSLKSFTSKKINEQLGKMGPLWAPQYYDHALRTEDEVRECVKYCLRNPVRKGWVGHFKEYPYWYCVYAV